MTVHCNLHDRGKWLKLSGRCDCTAADDISTKIRVNIALSNDLMPDGLKSLY